MLPYEVDRSIALIRLLEDWGHRIYVAQYGRVETDELGSVTFSEIQADNHNDFPEIQDLCVIHHDRANEVLVSRAA